MRSLNLDQLVPWVYVMPTPEQKALERAQALEQAKRHQLARMPTEEMLERLHERHATRRADLAWLKANMPIGTTFDHLGARCMVVGIFLSDGLIHKQWVAEVDMETAKGIRRTMLPVPVIRAYVEPGFVA